MDRAQLKAAIAAAATDSAKLRPIDVPGWPEQVFIRSITIAESGRLEQLSDDDPIRNARLIARMARDENGELLFDESNPDDIALLASQSVAVFNAIAAAPSKDADPGNA